MNVVFFVTWLWGLIILLVPTHYGLPTRSQWEPTRAEVEGNLPARPTRVRFCSGSAYAATVPAVFLTFRIRAMSAKLSVTRHLVH